MANTSVPSDVHRLPPEHILQFFDYRHLDEPERDLAIRLYDLAHTIVGVIPRNPERTVALRKLLEARDSVMRAIVAEDVHPETPR